MYYTLYTYILFFSNLFLMFDLRHFFHMVNRTYDTVLITPMIETRFQIKSSRSMPGNTSLVYIVCY